MRTTGWQLLPGILALLYLSTAQAGDKNGLPVEGNPMSTVKVIVFEDLQCPDCAAFRRMTDEQLLPRYGARIAVIHKDFPLAKHAWARQAAVAGRYFVSLSPELGVRYRQHIMSHIKETTPENFREKLAEFARGQGVNPEAALKALDNPELAALVERDVQEGVARGVVKTPTVYVNGHPFVETFTFEELAAAIDQAHP
ncbi:MAG: thioredoxin domain-containing protein [Acidobacteria bacterium]|nr:thioredoxin domain-containing protein [Acidobacteriota bacterium]